MAKTKITLWFMRETEKARLYQKLRPDRKAGDPIDTSDTIWIPKSIVEHTSIRGDEHTLDLPDWFIERNGL